MRPVIFVKKHEFTYLKLKNSCLTWQRVMFSTEISWKFMRDLGVVVFAAGDALVAFGFSFGRILL